MPAPIPSTGTVKVVVVRTVTGHDDGAPAPGDTVPALFRTVFVTWPAMTTVSPVAMPCTAVVTTDGFAAVEPVIATGAEMSVSGDPAAVIAAHPIANRSM